MNTSTAVVHVIDDDEPLRSSLIRVLQAAGHIARGYASAGDFLLAEPLDAPGCLLLDVQMPGPDGLELQTALVRHGHMRPIVFLSGHGDIPVTVRAIKAGAVDFLTKPVDRVTLLAAIDAALARDAQQRRVAAETAALSKRVAALTARERAVYRCLVTGKLNKQIAGALGISERTVKAHRAQLMDDMQARSLSQLVQFAEQLRAAGVTDLFVSADFSLQ